MRQYGVILADPPWQDHIRWGENTGKRTADQYYRTMPPHEIMALPVESLADDNCALFLWATWPELEQGLDVTAAWGFRYVTIAWVWAKLNPSGLGFHMGMGNYTRANSEPCLLAVRGKMPVVDKGVMSLIVTPVQKHSRKPDEQYHNIERLYPGMPYLELFARRPRPGWDIWGNEVDSTIELAGVTV